MVGGAGELLAGEPGFEPGLTESESAGLPLTYSPKRCRNERASHAMSTGQSLIHPGQMTVISFRGALYHIRCVNQDPV